MEGGVPNIFSGGDFDVILEESFVDQSIVIPGRDNYIDACDHEITRYLMNSRKVTKGNQFSDKDNDYKLKSSVEVSSKRQLLSFDKDSPMRTDKEDYDESRDSVESRTSPILFHGERARNSRHYDEVIEPIPVQLAAGPITPASAPGPGHANLPTFLRSSAFQQNERGQSVNSASASSAVSISLFPRQKASKHLRGKESGVYSF